MGMALQAAPGAAAPSAKRKLADAAGTPNVVKKLRSDNTPASPPTSTSLRPLSSFITDLRPKYEVKTLSVLSSTSISKRVDTILQHLGRFHPWDSTVLPGVVLLYARSNTTNKLITIAETVRRRIHEGDQKWYQYNRLYEMEWAAKQSSAARGQDHGGSVVEDTAMGTAAGREGGEDRDVDDDDGDDYFETMNGDAATPTQFERAVHGEPKARQMAHMSIVLSRVPVPELKARDSFTVQSNEEYIDYIRKKKAGLV
ncbi:hypothetical protein QBC33DRAFT_254841 [Phialemonium atrogriseum]|uniref:DNA/RNA-binding protein Alba-like domain-containing protein n=1 Tax=Phialemonium atrogriseum TaxID=1093897 RepID=A0AAJ0BTV0_9PEZI|nr:uncharacterized protein QBC33DRAFT_254841 [Phialemonium atrogriseum]KAK1762952.1 hypothetical protein QBC33DRAFT_254841 [Phialemonium atrogriseum]